MDLNIDFWAGKRVFVTGHTGFKGSWMCLLLSKLGAEVTGYSLEAENPSLFVSSKIGDLMTESIIADVRHPESVNAAIMNSKPEIIIHMAAMPLVRDCFSNPLQAFQTNTLGTINVLEAIRNSGFCRAALMVTTDKVYDNKEWIWPYSEKDTIGGKEPYGVSKTCAELATQAYTNCYFKDSHTGVATCRAGNVVGGGDWAKDRIIPDIIRAQQSKKELVLRNPDAIRPWQHVLEPLFGYALLAQKLYHIPSKFSGPWNFGPSTKDTTSVLNLVEMASLYFDSGFSYSIKPDEIIQESQQLKIDSTKAIEVLGWRPLMNVSNCLRLTFDWYNSWKNHDDMYEKSRIQIEEYLQMALKTK